jgi:hypothetical protein
VVAGDDEHAAAAYVELLDLGAVALPGVKPLGPAGSQSLPPAGGVEDELFAHHLDVLVEQVEKLARLLAALPLAGVKLEGVVELVHPADHRLRIGAHLDRRREAPSPSPTGPRHLR